MYKQIINVKQEKSSNFFVEVLSLPEFSFLIKLSGLRPATLLKKRLWRRCFPINFAKLLKTLFLRTPPGDCLYFRAKLGQNSLMRKIILKECLPFLFITWILFIRSNWFLLTFFLRCTFVLYLDMPWHNSKYYVQCIKTKKHMPRNFQVFNSCISGTAPSTTVFSFFIVQLMFLQIFFRQLLSPQLLFFLLPIPSSPANC